MSGGQQAVELLGVRKSFGRRAVLVDLNLTVRAGEVVCLHGASGAGKTTVLEVVAGALAPDAGSRTVTAVRIGYMFQDDCLIPWETVEDNVAFALAAERDDPGARETARQWLDKVGLADVPRKKPSELSGGMKRRVNLARSLAVRPDLLLLDEPFAFQDAATVDLIRRCVLEANRENGAAVILVSHDNPLEEVLAGRSLVLNDGRLAEE